MVEGGDGTGLWVQFKTTAAATNRQNSLNIYSTRHDDIISIGATRGSKNLGFVEIFVAAGETIRFSQHSNISDFNDSPLLRVSSEDFGYSLSLNDNSEDDDFDDLTIDITSSFSPLNPNTIALASQQTSSAAAVYDFFSSIPDSGLSVELSINSDCAFVNQLAFVSLDINPLTGLPYDDYRIGTITPDNHGAYKTAILNNLVQPGDQAIVATGQQTQVINWSLTPEEAGFYAPVLITPGNEVFTAGLLSASDGKQHTKLLGQNFVGFEDLLASQQSDWDFNDVTVLATVTTEATSTAFALEATDANKINDNLIYSVPGKGRLCGTRKADQFTFDQFETFGKNTADRIIRYKPSQGDTLGVSATAFPSLQGADEITFATAHTAKEVRRLRRQDIDFVYFETRGRLFFNGNGSDRGWGNPDEGGIFAFMHKRPELSAEDFTLLA